MNQKKYNDEILVDWRELFYVIWQRKVLILFVGVLGALMALICSKLFMTPLYRSEVSAYILQKDSIMQSGLTQNTMLVSNQLTNDYMELVESRWVLSGVIEDLELDETEKSLAAKISSSCKEDTRILVIAVTDKDPVLAQKIADTVCSKASERIKDVMGIEAVNVIDAANLPESPVSPNVKKNIFLGFMVCAVLAIAVISVVHMLDDTLKTPEEVERYFELSVLGSIPYSDDLDDTKKTRRKAR